MLPVSELNRLRREIVAELERQRATPKRWTINETRRRNAETPKTEVEISSAPQRLNGEPHLIVLVRDLAQLDAALQCGIRTIYCDFEDPKKYREAVTTFHTAFGCAVSGPHGVARPTIWVAPPRIFKTGEEWTLEQVRCCNADG